jgi:hypothetical protein
LAFLAAATGVPVGLRFHGKAQFGIIPEFDMRVVYDTAISPRSGKLEATDVRVL